MCEKRLENAALASHLSRRTFAGLDLAPGHPESDSRSVAVASKGQSLNHST
jgi:hypothetical protein